MIRAPTTRPTPHLIIPMSFQLAIPWRVALQHCPPPLHQPESILLQDRPNSGTSFTEGTNEWGCFENRNRLETAKQSTWGWVNDHENPWVNDCENPQHDPRLHQRTITKKMGADCRIHKDDSGERTYRITV